MKKYVKPQIEIKEFEVSDIVTSSGIFYGITDLDASKSVEWDDKILDPKDNF